MTASSLNRTPSYKLHLELGARMVPFGDWEMPIQYKGVIAEHHAVRTQSGIFDVSHMGEIVVSGPQAASFLQYITINDINRLSPGKGQYTAMLNPDGGIVDDLIVYQLESETYLMCVNAANDQKDFQWVQDKAKDFDVKIEHESHKWGQIAVQGPDSTQCLVSLLPSISDKIDALNYMDIIPIELFQKAAYLARTGYTGEKGYELYLPSEIVEETFRSLSKVSTPIGLGARDTLRLEACYLLYGNDMDDEVSPIEAGIGWATRMDCGDFIGKSVVETHKDPSTPRRQMIAFTFKDKGIPRSGMDIYKGDQKIGVVTSGGHLPSLGCSGGMALISKGTAAAGDDIWVDVRGKRKLAQVTKKPLYSAKIK